MRHARNSRAVSTDTTRVRAERGLERAESGIFSSLAGSSALPWFEHGATEYGIAGENAHYRHIFGVSPEAELPGVEALDALGAAMQARPYSSGDSDIPAGYTYLGQFIFHDITGMVPGKSPHLPGNARSPALDLDSVLPGLKPLDSPELCAADGLFKIGVTAEFPQPEDLPRLCRKPQIADTRNDDFLPLAQCHLLLLKFYNAAARHLGHDGSQMNEAWWGRLRTLWRQHFQSVVLHDYLPRVIDRETYRDVLENGRRLVRTGTMSKDEAWLPIEFAGAAGRFGHSMVRDHYHPWNKRLAWTVVTVEDFMNFSYANSGDKLDDGVPFLWSTNWLNLFDFSSSGYAGDAVVPIKAASIDTHLAPQLHNLPSRLRSDMCNKETRPGPSFSLATATMKRGRQFRLAAAQHALKIANGWLGGSIPELGAEALFPQECSMAEVVVEFPELASATPLWYYVLKEAELLGHGNKLGPLGGRIVMETLHAAIEATEDSILARQWEPTFPAKERDKYSITDLILFSAHPNPVDPY